MGNTSSTTAVTSTSSLSSTTTSRFTTTLTSTVTSTRTTSTFTPTSTSHSSSTSTSTSSPTPTSTRTTLSTITTSSSTSANSCSPTPPAPTQTGIVSGCSQWYVAQSGDYCYKIATAYGISTNQFISWNPAVGSNCGTLYAGDAYCVSTACPPPAPPPTTTTTVSHVTTYTSTCGPTSTSTPVNAGSDTYTAYYGNGSPSNGWPCASNWVDFDSMWSANLVLINSSCAQWNVPNNSADETSTLKSMIQWMGNGYGVDIRFVLAIIMQESKGCVRVPSTFGSHLNPGLMQTNQGKGSCNTNIIGQTQNGTVQTPCPLGEIITMVQDGVNGTGPGQYGLVQYMQIQGLSGAQGYYRTARSYNSGAVAADGNLEEGGATASYASDVANRLTGWVLAQSTFQS